MAKVMDDEMENYPAKGTNFFQDEFGERIIGSDEIDAEMASEAPPTEEMGATGDPYIDSGKAFRERLDEPETTDAAAEEIKIIDEELAFEEPEGTNHLDSDRSM